MTMPVQNLDSHGDRGGVPIACSTDRKWQSVKGLVDGYAIQDLDGIMSHFSDDAVYCDVMGRGLRGDEYRGKAAIRRAITRQFDLSGRHTYVDAKLMVDGNSAFASWTLVLGDPADPSAPKFEGIDEFAFDVDGRVALKKAWLKGQPRLRRALIGSNPGALVRHLGYSLQSLVR